MAKVIASKPKKILTDPEGPWIKHTTDSDYKIYVNESFRQSLTSKRELSTSSFGRLIIINKTSESSLISPVISLSGSNLLNIPNRLFFMAIHPEEGFVQNYDYKLDQPPLSFNTKFFVEDEPSKNPLELLIPGKTLTLTYETTISINRSILYLNYATPELEGDPLTFNTTKGEINETKGKNDKNENITIKIVNLKQLDKGDKIEIVQKSKLKILPGELFFGETRVSYICESPLSNLQLATTNCLTETSEEIEIERKSENLKKWGIHSKILNESSFPITIQNIKIYSDRKLQHEHKLNPVKVLEKGKEWTYNTKIDLQDIKIPELSHNVKYSVSAEVSGKYEGYFNFLGYNIDIKQK
ncbi:MAG: hypothetical protein ACW967_10000 [Candidatus Hodarchaeales archaeon]|jgi:hypothetical protein